MPRRSPPASGGPSTRTSSSTARTRVYTAQVERGEAIQVARSLEETDDALRELALILAAVSLGGIALGAALGLLVSRTALSPSPDSAKRPARSPRPVT